MLKLLEFMAEHDDWEARLAQLPYCINIKRADGYIMFSYGVGSDFCVDIVRECRGIILDETDGYKPVCIPFFKFGNYGEPYAEDIDWNSARVIEKIDGSLIKVWNDKGQWRVSTNNAIDAKNVDLMGANGNFRQIFDKAWANTGRQFCDLNPNYTYLFELVSPQTRVVIPYEETKIYHLGTRDNHTLLEIHQDISIEKPREFSIATIEDCIEAAKNLDQYNEGFVVVDSKWRRVKVKSPLYVAIHHTLNNVSHTGRVIDLIMSGEDAEVLSYFPEYAKMFDPVRERIDRFIAHNEQELEAVRGAGYATRKDLAAYVTKTICPSCLFTVIDGKAESVKDFVYKQPADKIERYINQPH